MFPTELDLQAQRQQLEREVAKHQLAQLAKKGQPTLIERLRTRLNSAQPIHQAARKPLPQPSGLIATSR